MSTTKIIDSPNDKNDKTANPPTIIGIYGVSGSGKTTLLSKLKTQLKEQPFNFYEGSEELPKRTGRTLEDFKELSDAKKDVERTKTIEAIRDECAKAGKTGIIVGHYMFWKTSKVDSEVAMTDADKKAYTHILYLKNDPKIIAQQVKKDSTRTRPPFSEDNLANWQTAEEGDLRSICLDNNILFTTIQPDDFDKTIKLVRNATEDDETTSAAKVEAVVDSMLQTSSSQKVKTMLVLDADHTLGPCDASKLYWEAAKYQGPTSDKSPLKALFQKQGYTYNAFRQATWLYEEDAAGNSNRFDELCRDAASRIKLYPQMKDLLNSAVADDTTNVVIVTCGLRPVWEIFLDSLGLRQKITVIGASRLSDGYLVTPKTKQDIVSRLKTQHKMYVTAIGDSEVDLPMLKKADKAFLVVGSADSRSNSIETKLQEAIDNEGLRAQQILLPEPLPRLNTKQLPTATLDGSFLPLLKKHHSLKLYDATDKMASKILASNTRDADFHGPNLQKAHEDAGWYLATEYVSTFIGVEPYTMTSVQGKEIQGHRLFDEEKTCIVPLMRGGDPMARRVHKAFPLAMYHHADEPAGIQAIHVSRMNTIILVDWVINTGKSIVEFVKHIRENLSSQIRIVIVAGVVQEEAIGVGDVDGILKKETAGLGDVALIAMRISKNKYPGRGGTDTGHRLFNTTHLD